MMDSRLLAAQREIDCKRQFVSRTTRRFTALSYTVYANAAPPTRPFCRWTASRHRKDDQALVASWHPETLQESTLTPQYQNRCECMTSCSRPHTGPEKNRAEPLVQLACCVLSHIHPQNSRRINRFRAITVRTKSRGGVGEWGSYSRVENVERVENAEPR